MNKPLYFQISSAILCTQRNSSSNVAKQYNYTERKGESQLCMSWRSGQPDLYEELTALFLNCWQIKLNSDVVVIMQVTIGF